MAVVGFWNNLVEAQRLVTDTLLAGVIEEIIEEGHLIPQMPVMQLDSKSLKYNREETLPSAQFYDINEELTEEAVVDYLPVTAELKRCIGQWDLDNFLIRTYRDPNDMEALAVSQCRKGVMRYIEQKLIYGDNTTYPKEFDGFRKTVASGQIVAMTSSATPQPLSLAKLDEMIDKVKGGIDFLLMNFEMKRRFDAMNRQHSSYYGPMYQQQMPAGKVAEPILYYKGIPILRTDFITQLEKYTSGGLWEAGVGTGTSIWAVRLGLVSDGGVCLVTGNPMFEFTRIEPLEKKDAIRFRLVWYLTMAQGSTKSLAVIDGISDAEIVL